MIYPIECHNFQQVALVSLKFEELYTKEKNHKIYGKDGSIWVNVNGHEFAFYYKGKYENSIKVEDFAKKYFTPKSQVL